MTAPNSSSPKTDDPSLKKIYRAIFEELQRNLRSPSGYLNGVYAVPGGKYQRSWLWDSAFLSQIWLLTDASVAKEILLTHTLTQRKNGMIPHMVGPDYKSSITQPPLLTWAAWRIYEQTRDNEFVSKIYPYLKAFNEWFRRNRDFNNDGLFSWVRPDESGWDDSPRFDGIRKSQACEYYPHPDLKPSERIHPEFGNLDMRSIQALDLNCFLVVDMSCLARMANILRLKVDEGIFKERVAGLSQRIRSNLWSNDDNFFYDLGPKGLIRVKTPAAFLTLFAEVADKDQAKALIQHLMNEGEFWTPYPVPTVAINEPRFSLRYWRGPVWVNINYLVYLGLKTYGFDGVASQLSDRTIEMVADAYMKKGCFCEFYNPFAPTYVEGFSPPKPEKHFAGWTGLVANLLVNNHSG